MLKRDLQKSLKCVGGEKKTTIANFCHETPEKLLVLGKVFRKLRGQGQKVTILWTLIRKIKF